MVSLNTQIGLVFRIKSSQPVVNMNRKQLAAMVGYPNVAIAYDNLQKKMISEIIDFHTEKGAEFFEIDLEFSLTKDEEEALRVVLRIDDFQVYFSEKRLYSPVIDVTRIALKL